MENITEIWNMIFNISLNMLHNRADAEDAAQEIFIIVNNNYKQFRWESKLETWIYRIAFNFLIKKKVKGFDNISYDIFEADGKNYQEYKGEYNLSKEEERIFVDEVKVGCTTAMLQCLEPENRFIFVLGEIFSFRSSIASEICGLRNDVYRKRLSRTKSKVKNFMRKNCGLINEDANCKCRKRIRIAKERGSINLEKAIYRTSDKKIKDYIKELNEIDEISQIFRDNPYIDVIEKFRSQMDKTYKILTQE